jgi:hypothetical protein
MNQYTELLKYLKTLAEKYGANTVTKDAPDSIDLEKTNIYPLVNISIANGSFSNGSTINFNVAIEVITNRDKNNTVINDKFYGNDNEIDNYNDTLAIINKMWTAMFRDFEENNITASESPSFEKISLEGVNMLDGWELSFDVEVPNTTLNLCGICQ